MKNYVEGKGKKDLFIYVLLLCFALTVYLLYRNMDRKIDTAVVGIKAEQIADLNKIALILKKAGLDWQNNTLQLAIEFKGANNNIALLATELEATNNDIAQLAIEIKAINTDIALLRLFDDRLNRRIVDNFEQIGIINEDKADKAVLEYSIENLNQLNCALDRLTNSTRDLEDANQEIIYFFYTLLYQFDEQLEKNKLPQKSAGFGP